MAAHHWPEWKPRPGTASVGLKDIVREVAERRQVEAAAIMGPTRRRPIALARQEAMAEAYRRTALTMPAIGRRMGRDASTVSHGIAAHARRMAEAGA